MLEELRGLYQRRLPQYASAEIAFAASRYGESAHFIRGCVRFIHDTSKDRERSTDYGQLFLERALVPNEVMLAGVQGVTSEATNVGRFQVPAGPFANLFFAPWEYHAAAGLPNAIGEPRYSSWPSRVFSLTRAQGGTVPDPPGPIARGSLPLVTDVPGFIDDFVEVPMYKWPGMNNGLLVFLPDFRARVRQVAVHTDAIATSFEPGTTDSSELAFRVAVDDVEVPRNLLETGDNSLTVVYRGPPVQSLFQFFLVDTGADEIVDWVNLRAASTYASAEVVYDQPGGIVRQLIQQGEGQALEFKEQIGDGRRIVQTVIAFANTNEGTILVGVNDEGLAVGVNPAAARRAIEESISRQADPFIQVTYEDVEVSGKRILVLRVPRGAEPPYVNRDSGAVYVRRGSTNFHATSQEIREMSGRPTR